MKNILIKKDFLNIMFKIYMWSYNNDENQVKKI